MRNAIPNRVAEMALTTGKLFSTQEALKESIENFNYTPFII